MTILDNGRVEPNYREEAARAIWRARGMRTEPRLRRLEPDAMDMATGAFALVMADADAAISALRKLGAFHHEALAVIKSQASSNARDLLAAQAQDQGLYDTTGGGE